MAAGFIVVTSLGYLAYAPMGGWEQDPQHHAVYARTVELMRDGVSYYPAQDQALHEVFGGGEAVWAFRLPYIYWVWQLLPTEAAIWVAFVILAMVSGLLLLALVRGVLIAPLVVVYLLATALHLGQDGWVAQFAFHELWAVPLVIGTLVAWDRDRPKVAAGLALAAFLVREVTAGLLLGGLVLALRSGRDRLVWAAATTAAAAAFALHAVMAAPFVVPAGAGLHAPLLGTAELPRTFGLMTGFGLPLSVLLGPLLLAMALWHLWSRGAPGWLAAAHLGLLGASALVINRPYWGVVIVPLTLVFAADAALGSIDRLRGRVAAPVSGDT